MGTLDGKIAVIVGGSSGLGLGVAERLAEEGAKLVLAARSRDKLQEVAERLDALAVPCDITRDADVAALAAAALEKHGRIDVAVNSAGYEDNVPVRDLTPERLEPMVAVQFNGAVYFIRHMANAMSAGGSVITVSSLTATLVAEGYAGYAGAKAGINHVTRIAASEYGPAGVRINVVAATLVETPMTAHIFKLPGATEAFVEETPLGRMGTVRDVVEAVAWLASDASGFVTGQNLHVDGGTSLRRLPRPEQFMRHMKAAMEKDS